jgi:predicted phosphoribosyltransferase
MRFKDRADAGEKLAKALARYKSEDPIVMALPRGGVPVAAKVAEALNAPLGIILVRKIGAPSQPELALGAVVDGNEPVIVHNPHVMAWTGTSDDEFQQICKRELAEIERRRDIFLGNRPSLKPEGRVTIVIDDGIATGATTRVALRAMRMHHPKKLVLAAPVAPASAMQDLLELADDVVTLTNLEPMGAVGYFYDDFEQLTDRDVTNILSRFTEAGRSSPQSRIDAAQIRSIAGDIDEAKISEILRLKPNAAEIQEAVRWALGDGDILGKRGHVLDGKAAAIYDILTADEDEEEREGVSNP